MGLYSREWDAGFFSWSQARQPFSNTGKEVDLVAPDVNVYRLDLNDEIVLKNGTPFATPHVTALAALIKQKYPHCSNKQISAALSKNAEKLGSPRQYGSGIPDALFLILIQLFKAATMCHKNGY
ncbi:S8 family serine peptidase [Paenibacillus sp. F411]|nr:S8 family serine peptidase [Paenibacillus sp. F411]